MKNVHAKEVRPVQGLAADPDEDMSASTGAAANRDEETCDLGEGFGEQSDVALALALPVTQTDFVASSLPTPHDVGHSFDLDAG